MESREHRTLWREQGIHAWLAASVPLWSLGETEFRLWHTTVPHCLDCSLSGKGRGAFLFCPRGSGRGKQGLEGRCILKGPQKPWANVCPLQLHTHPGFLFLLCLSQLGLSVPILCSFLAFEPSIISTWALSSLQLSPAAQTPSGSWLMAFLLTLAQLMSIPPAANPTSLGGEATSAYCSPLPLSTNTNCNGPLRRPSRMSQGSVARGFRI